MMACLVWYHYLVPPVIPTHAKTYTHTLTERELDHRRRETLVQQLITSERAYYESLRVVQQVFIEPLQKDAKQSSFNFLGMKKLVCTERETRWLFGNFDEIVQVHQEILASLEER